MDTITLPSAIATTVQAASRITPQQVLDSPVVTAQQLASRITPSVTLQSPIELEDTAT